MPPPARGTSGVWEPGCLYREAKGRRAARNAGRLARQPCRDATARNRDCLASGEARQPRRGSWLELWQCWQQPGICMQSTLKLPVLRLLYLLCCPWPFDAIVG
jgi:hypothetical protein